MSICKILRLDGTGQDPRHGGFTDAELLAECQRFYANVSVKLRFEFVDTDVMQIVRDTRLTFFDQLGIMGEEISVAGSACIRT